MSWLKTIFILAGAFLAVFWEAAFPGLRYLLGAQIDLLPPLVVYAALATDLTTLCLVSVCGGLWFDSLSANPLGITVLPLFVVGLAIYSGREVVLRHQVFAQVVLGLAASGAAPVLTLALLLSSGHGPLLGWGTLWQLLVMALGGAAATPIVFIIFEWLERAFGHARIVQTSFRSDREIRRGR